MDSEILDQLTNLGRDVDSEFPKPKRGRKKKADTKINELEDNDVRDKRERLVACVLSGNSKMYLQSVSWILAEFYFNRGLQRLYTGTSIILQKTINGFLCLLIVFLKSKTYQLILKDVIKLNRNLR